MQNKRMGALVAALFMLLLFSTPSLATQAAQVAVSTTPASIGPGNNGYVSISITNTGSENVDKLKVYLGRVDTQLIFNPLTTEMGALGSGKSTTAVASFSVPSGTPSGYYTAEFRVDACYNSICTSYSQVALISVQSQSTLQVASVKPGKLSIGSSDILNFTLSNTGDLPINNVVVTWSASGMVFPQGTSSRLVVPVLPASKDTVLSVPVIVNPAATPGVYSFVIYVQYTDQTGTQQATNSTVGFTINGFYNWVVTLDSQETIAPGGSGTATVKLSNAGNQEALYLISTVSSPSFHVSPKEAYISSIKGDDWDTEVLTLTPGNVAPGIYPVQVDIAWKDLFGQSYTESHTVDILVSPVSLGSWPIILLVLIVIGAGGWYLVKKKQILKKLHI